MVESYRDLKVWQRAIEMSIALYKLTEKFPAQKFTASPVNSDALVYPLQAILPRVTGAVQEVNTSISWEWLVDQIMRSKHS